MLFFCFSSKDRQDIVEAILYHISNYQIPVWYDRHKMLLGDDRNYKNFIDGVEASPYGIVILSPNSIQSHCANEELDLMKKKHENATMTVFPLFFNLTVEEVTPKYQWLKELVYKEVKTSIDVRSTCNHVVCKILLDELEKYTLNDFHKLLIHLQENKSDPFILNILQSYMDTDGRNFNARIALLYAACTYVQTKYNTKNLPLYYTAGFMRMFNETKLSIEINLRELLIIERLFMLLVNTSVLSNVSKDL